MQEFFLPASPGQMGGEWGETPFFLRQHIPLWKVSVGQKCLLVLN